MLEIHTALSTLKVDIEITPEQVPDIFRVFLDYVYGTPKSPIAPPVKPPIIEESPAPVPVPPKEPKKEIPKESTSKSAFKGFLYIKCEKCGQFKAFMPKTPISKYHCDCGHTTRLEVMTPMKVNCKCGKHFSYQTNALDSTISINCFSCGAPVDLEYHEKRNEYLTIT